MVLKPGFVLVLFVADILRIIYTKVIIFNFQLF